ncbi:Uncharacterised protein [Serratia quinivorans]|uniref:hypothetical protein n=1 Tax=Serratia TaxID=613 RepID=UPI00217A0370|nr:MULTISPECIES: hypothetical protein [Serratia]CAI0836410.1 Uncharacterised protein [Serratia quinivorans]CAI1032810.1 Uncharacterised protein [Serratia quinivorans]CAI1034539.1 Uncharacterised protein [Serratia quinivorans]CAI1049924.1 Uncharacterised protein [Serratia quinivorans]CAI1125075.1 Uncharacterised protein [Serratia entomophila]
MLKTQMEIQKARELALHYLSAIGTSGTPEDYLIQLKAVEQQFLVLLRQAGNAK